MMLVAVVTVLFWSFQQITEAAAQRQHINLELDSANDLLSSLKDAETGYRGFLLTGDEAYLEPYQLVRGNIDSKNGKANVVPRPLSTVRRLIDMSYLGECGG